MTKKKRKLTKKPNEVKQIDNAESQYLSNINKAAINEKYIEDFLTMLKGFKSENDKSDIIKSKELTTELLETLFKEGDLDDSVFKPLVLNFVGEDRVRITYSIINMKVSTILKNNKDTLIDDVIIKLNSLRYEGESGKFIVKLYDHIQLAQFNYGTMTEYLSVSKKAINDKSDTIIKEINKSIKEASDDEFKKATDRSSQIVSNMEGKIEGNKKQIDKSIIDSLKNAKQESKDELSKLKDSMYTQLITLLSIFTAIAFVLFGGLGISSTVFSGLSTIPIWETLIIGCFITMTAMSLVFLFMKFILIIIEKDVDKDKDKKINIICYYRYGMIVFFVLLMICCYFSEANKVECKNDSECYYYQCEEND